MYAHFQMQLHDYRKYVMFAMFAVCTTALLVNIWNGWLLGAQGAESLTSFLVSLEMSEHVPYSYSMRV